MRGDCLACEFNDCGECDDLWALGACCCGRIVDALHDDFDDGGDYDDPEEAS